MNLELTNGERTLIDHARDQAQRIDEALAPETLDTESLREVRRLCTRITGTCDYLLAKHKATQPLPPHDRTR